VGVFRFRSRKNLACRKIEGDNELGSLVEDMMADNSTMTYINGEEKTSSQNVIKVSKVT
jgi:hypothetical protein